MLVEYMADFAQPQEQDGHISYNTDVRCAVLGRARAVLITLRLLRRLK